MPAAKRVAQVQAEPKKGDARTATLDVKLTTIKQHQMIERAAAAVGLDESSWLRMVTLINLGWQAPTDSAPELSKPGHVSFRATERERQCILDGADGGGITLTELILPHALRIAGWRASDDPDFVPRRDRGRKKPGVQGQKK